MKGRARAAAVLAVIVAGGATTALVVERRGGETVDGAVVYARRCAFCHDAQGAIGADITAATMASYGTEEALYRYLRLAMPYEAPGTMSDEEYRATARHLVETRGIAGDPGGPNLNGDAGTEGDTQ